MRLTKPQRLVYDMEKFAGGAIAVICGSVMVQGSKDLPDLKNAVQTLYRMNAALRIRIEETADGVSQTVGDYIEGNVETLHFEDKAQFNAYAEQYAKEPLDIHGPLCDIKIVLLDDSYGILVKLHHIVGDAWTLALIASQFCAVLNGETPDTYSYLDYIGSEETYLQSARYAKDRTFFLEQFKECDEVTYLSEKQVHSFDARRKTFVIEAEQAQRITAYAKECHTSPFVLFMTAFAAYINRTKLNTERFNIGTAVLNRSGVREKNTMGMFINTVPMLMKLNSKGTFAENLSSVQETAFSVFRHQKYNYGDVLTDIRKEYSFTEKLYDVMLSYQNAAITGAAGKFESAWYHSGAQTESLQIHIDDRDSEGIFRIHYDYQAEKFTEREIERMYEHMTNLLFDAIGNDDKKLCELELLSAAEKQKLLYDFNDTAVDYPRDKCVHTLFEEQAAKTPDKTAVIACDATLTYAELNRQANRIAHGLIAKGVKPGDIVAFALHRKSYLIAAIFGILKSGAAYMPIDLDYPQERVDYMLEDSGAKLFLTDDGIEELLVRGRTDNPAVPMSSEDLCYCIYTSGTTGKPKGTTIRHRNLVNFCASNAKNNLQYYIAQNCRTVLACGSITFDISIFEIILSLLLNKSVVFANEQEVYNAALVADLIDKNEVDCIHCTPTKLHTYFANTRFAVAFAKVKCVMAGGEYLTDDVYDVIQQYGEAMVFNGYGPTETTMGVSFGEVNQYGLTIGKPIANTQIYIIDQYMRPLPIGAVGELCIAGDGVGAGYLHRPELTAEKFIDNPFGEGKLYKTGDLAYWREDGNIVYVGRNDFQVKIRGLRVELGEIENAIDGVEGISEAVVVVRKNGEGRQLICAFYTGEVLDAREIRNQIGQRLPKYMLPHSFTHLDALPLTASGKADRKALPEIDLSSVALAVEYVAPDTSQEKALTSAIGAVLNIERIGVLDNFFDLGGDSLKAIELIAQLEKAGYHVDTKTIFACDTVRELAKALTTAAAELEPVFDFTGDIPATSAQMRVYTAQSMDGDSTMYNVPCVFKVKSLDPERLERAIMALIDRHEMLRIRFENKDGQIIQIVEDHVPFALEQLTSDDISAFVRPFDLSRTPLLRVGYYENTVMIDMHHIVTDGASLPIFLQELNAIYMGREHPDAPALYRQFAVQEVDYQESEQYWLSVYEDELPVLELNTDFKREQKRSFNGSAIYDSIDSALHHKILAKCRELNITPYVFYMSGFYILLSKFSGNEDIVVGMPISGREGRYLDTIGMFVNTIALRNRPEGIKSVRDFLAEVRDTSVEAIAHQEYPYGELVKKLNANTMDRNPLFDVMFAYQSEAMTDIVFGGEKAELLPVPVTTSKYDFTFNIMPGDADVVLMAEYCTDLYRESTMRRFLAGYKLVLEQMFQPDILLKDITAITPEEEHTLRIAFNDTAVDYPRDKCVHTLFEEQAAKTPDKTAVIACDGTLTYAELNEQANRIAHGLIARGVKTGDIVAFALHRKGYLIAAILGILKSGAAYMPIDLDYPQERVDYILRDSGAKLFLTDDGIEELLASGRTDNPVVSMSSENLCYCIYTSGTTGVPKGTLIQHCNLMNFCNNSVYNEFQKNMVAMSHISLSCASVSFDLFAFETFLPLLNGLRLVLAGDEECYLGTKLAALIDHHKVDAILTTPSKISSYLQSVEFSGSLKQVQIIMIGAEQFPDSLYEAIHEHTDALIYNGYGPTEITIGACFYAVKDKQPITIGKPIANTQIYIVDKYMKLCPLGAVGELCIAGAGVGAGYLNRPELTAEKFIDNPFGEGKLYKTGDLAYWREDGNIVYVGRNDFQVKIRGLRIELGEIENAISAVAGVSQSVVVVRKDESGRQLICAFYTESGPTSVEQIRAAIRDRLPRYMMPHIFTLLTQMPLTSSGKINRKGLPEVDLSSITSEVEYVAPDTLRENVLATAIETVLGVERVGVLDNFFDLGGDSLKAIELIARLEKAGYHVDTKTIFACDTVRELAEALTMAAEASEPVFDFSGDIPATSAQMRVYTAQSMDGDSTMYNVPCVFKVKSLDPERLERAIIALVDRHEMLRTRFENKDGQIIQVVENRVPFVLERLSSDDISAFVRPYDLTSAPLLRAGYYENTVMLDMHHIVTDGASQPIFLRELNELYMGRALPNTPALYRQFAMQEVDHQESEKYWLSVYEDEVPVLELNTDFKREQKRGTNGDVLYDAVDADFHHKVLSMSKELGITPYVFYMSGFYILLSKFSGNEDIVVGMPISGREGRYLDTVGMFVNTIALRNRPEGAKSVRQFLTEVRDTSVEAIAHQEYPYGELVKKLNANTMGRNPLFDVMFAYQSEKLTDVIFGDEQAELLPLPVTTSKYDFTFTVLPGDEGAVLMAEYCTDLYRENTMRRFLDGYKLVLEQMFQPDILLKDITAITPEEEHTLRIAFNDTAVDYPRDKCVHTLFEEQAAKTPDKTAVIACDGTLTYAQLNEQANRIAHELIAKGVEPGDIVAFILPRRSYLIAAMLGILKTGAAYMPIDPDYPQDRISYMLEDSGAKLCITEELLNGLLSNADIENPGVYCEGTNVCYCIYTSGSTGKPKGTLLTHRSVANYVHNNNNNNVVHKIIKNSYNTILSVTTVGFDIFVTEGLLPLANGLQIIFASESQATIQSELNALLERYPTDVMQTTPTKMRSLIQDTSACGYLRSLKAIILGGEALDGGLVHELQQLTSAQIFNIYGPTETTVWSTNAEICPATQKQKLLSNFSDTDVHYPRIKCVYQLFEEQVRITPDKAAVIFHKMSLSYRQLYQLIEDYAASIVSLGISKGDVVAVHIDRSHMLIAFQLAVLKIGAIFLPVDKRYPLNRIQYMCSDCDVKLLISDELCDGIENTVVVSLNDFKNMKAEATVETQFNQDTCYIIYTSGSTGMPKGCMLTNKGLVNFCVNNNTLKTLRQRTDNIFACVNSVSFDYFIAESLLPLLNGYATVVLDDSESTNQSLFLDVVKENNINVLMTTPTRLKLYFDEANNRSILNQLTCICTSGEPLPPELLSTMWEKSPHAQIYNPLGPSECSVWNVGGELNKDNRADIHIGKPIANTQVYIVDKYMKLCPICAAGELCIAGSGVGAGYLNRPELTAEKFIDNPFGEGKLYKTGDLAYWRGDGNIVYLGRNDFQVKIRGLRIELGEIESAICSVDGVSQAVVVVRKDDTGRQIICAFYTESTPVAMEQIRDVLKERLPRYMMPHIFTLLPQMPLTSSGKINRKGLPEVDLGHVERSAEYIKPEGALEMHLAETMEQVLKYAPVGRADHFFDLGGDSLKAIEFVSKAHNEAIYFALQNVFDYPTVQQLAEYIEHGNRHEISYDEIDFTEADRILAKNKVEHIATPQKSEVGNILLAGATGYLGIHILADFLEHDSGTAYCLVRGKDKADSEKRLAELLEFYFGNRYSDMNRIVVLCADLKKDYFGLTEQEYAHLLSEINTVINAAASVKHYGSYRYFHETNVESVKRLIQFCMESNAKLVHASTISVSGNSSAEHFDGYVSETEKHFYESSLYIGQPLENVYARSKFEAERAVLEAMGKGLRANIMRMGNLTNRLSDGVFQKNHESNAALKRMKGILELGVFPDYLMPLYAEFTPIDEAASAVMTITRHFSTEQTVFHINSTKVVYMDKLVAYIKELGYRMDVVSGAEFTDALRKTMEQSGMEFIFETFINDMDSNDQLNYDSNIRIENDFTVRYLRQLGFEWSDIGLEYLRKYVAYFEKIGYWGK